MDVCEMKKGDLPFRIKGQQLILGQLLPRSSGSKAWKSRKDAGTGRRKL